MRRSTLLFILLVTLLVAAILLLVSMTKKEQDDVLIPTLTFGALHYSESELLGMAGNIPINIFTETQAQAGSLLPANEHNVLRCPTSFTSALVSFNTPNPSTTRIWGYKYSGNEKANKDAGKSGRELFDGEFYFTPAELSHIQEDKRSMYQELNTFTMVTGSRSYYFMAEIPLCFHCGSGLRGNSFCGSGSSSVSQETGSGSSLSGSGTLSSMSGSGSSLSASGSTLSSSSTASGSTVSNSSAETTSSEESSISSEV